MKMSDCVFCGIVAGAIPAQKVLENEAVLAFWDLAPSAEKHILIVPKAHVSSFMELDDPGVLEELRRAAQKIVLDLELGNGFRLVFNGGKFQHVPHLHWHLLGGELRKIVGGSRGGAFY